MHKCIFNPLIYVFLYIYLYLIIFFHSLNAFVLQDKV